MSKRQSTLKRQGFTYLSEYKFSKVLTGVKKIIALNMLTKIQMNKYYKEYLNNGCKIGAVVSSV